MEIANWNWIVRCEHSHRTVPLEYTCSELEFSSVQITCYEQALLR